MTAEPLATREAVPSRVLVHAYLQRLLASDAFGASARRRKLLEYVVEQTLAGHADRLKAFDLALAVLGRDERFDPQNDPIVRIEVGRLRRDLDHYYAGAGSGDPIRIAIPKGHYVPTFEIREPSPSAPARAPPARRLPRPPGWLIGAIAMLSAILLGAAVWHLSNGSTGTQVQRAGPAVLVLPFRPLGGGGNDQLLANGLTADLIADLMRFDGIEVYAGQWPSQGPAALPAAADAGFAYEVTRIVEPAPGRVRVTASLSEHMSGRVIWSQSYDRALSTDDVFGVRDELTAAIVGRLAQGYGIINTEAAGRLRQGRPATLFAYDCVQRAFAYRRTFAPGEYGPVRACLEEAVRRDPNYAGAWAMLAFAHLDAARYGLVEPAARAAELDAGLAAAERAVEIAPDSVRSLQSLAALHFGRGDYDEAERVQRKAIALNPHDPESLAQLGWRLMVRGQWQEGGTLLQEAIDRSVVVPAWYHETLAGALYLGGNLQRARDAAELGKADCCPGYAILAITEAALGNTAAARAALDEAIRQSPELARDPVAYWTGFQVAPAVIERLNAGLARAGLPMPAKTDESPPRS